MKKTTTPDAEPTKQLDPRIFRDNKINAMDIFGIADFVEGRTTEIQDHPGFPNPRSSWNMDRDIVEEIASSGEIMEPVKLFWNSQNQVILVDGKTRMTGIGLFLKQNPKLIGKLEVPIQRVRGDENEIQLLMLKVNLLESRRPLTEVDVSKYLRKLNAQGVQKEAMLKVLDKGGRKGLIWLNHMMQIIDANPEVVKAYDHQEIDFTTAKMIAKQPFQEQPHMLDTIRVLKKEMPAAKEAQIRKLAGVKKANRVTLGFDATLNFLFDNVYLPGYQFLQYDAETQRKHGIIDRKMKTLAKREGVLDEYEEYLKIEEIRSAFQFFMLFMKQSGVTVLDQRAFVESQLDEDQRAALNGIKARLEQESPVEGKAVVSASKRKVRVT